MARVHDNRTPHRPADWQQVLLDGPGRSRAMTWFGENLFRAPAPRGGRRLVVCATDAAGNEACAPVTPWPVGS